MVTRSCRGQCCRRMKSGFSFQQNGSLGGFDTRITFLPSCFLSNSNSPFDETIHNLSSSSLSLKLKRCWKRKRLRRFSDVLYFRPSEGPSSALKKMSLFSQRWVFTLIECLGGSHTLIWNEEKNIISPLSLSFSMRVPLSFCVSFSLRLCHCVHGGVIG